MHQTPVQATSVYSYSEPFLYKKMTKASIWNDLKTMLSKHKRKEDQLRVTGDLVKREGAECIASVLADGMICFSAEEDIPLPDLMSLIYLFCQCGVGFDKVVATSVLKSATSSWKSSQSASSNPDDFSMDVNPELLRILLQQVESDEAGQIADISTETLCVLIEGYGIRSLDVFLDMLSNCWTRVVSSDLSTTSASRRSVISFRYFTLLVSISAQVGIIGEGVLLDEMMQRILTSESAGNDPLLQISAIDLLEHTCRRNTMHDSFSEWLFSSNFVYFLLSLSGGLSKDSDPDPFLGGPSIRLLSMLCKLVRTKSYLAKLDGGKYLIEGFRISLMKVNVNNELDRLAFIDAVASYCASSSDAINLVNDIEIRESWLWLSNAQPKMKAFIINSVACVIDSRLLSKSDVLFLIEVFGDVNRCPVGELILAFVRKPIPETRLAAYNLMRAICASGKGAQLLLSTAGLYEYLVNRDTENTKLGKEAKYEVIVAIMNSSAKGLLADNIASKLEEFVKQGAHYKPAMSWDVIAE